MTQRETWQALQGHLAAARRFVDGGDPRGALAEVTAALSLDPDFLAAQSLRARILKQWPATLVPAMPSPSTRPAPASVVGASAAQPVPITGAPPVSSAAALLSTPPIVSGALRGSAGQVDLSIDDVPLRIATPPRAPEPPSPNLWRADTAAFKRASQASVPLPVSAEGFARFEARARRRRVDRRIEVARAAIERRRLHEAASVLDEIIALDPNLPELAALTAEFDELRKSIASPHRGPWFLAAAVFVVFVLGASWLHESSLLVSYPVKTYIGLVAPPQPALIPEPVQEEPAVIATAGTREVENAIDEREIAPPPRPRREIAPAVSAVLRMPATPEVSRPTAPVAPLPVPAPDTTIPVVNESAPVSATVTPAPPPPAPPPPAPAPRASPPIAMAITPAAVPVVPSVVEDESLVKSTLQRYRRAYERLDAHSAQAVWPAVNQVALARAFDGLASQSITFDQCDVQVRGSAASATCRGTARYVPKIGNREPRVESRVWSFALRKDAGEWKIDSARAER